MFWLFPDWQDEPLTLRWQASLMSPLQQGRQTRAPSNKAVAWACGGSAGHARPCPCPLLETSASNQQWAVCSAIRTRSQKCPASRSRLCDFMGTSWKPVAHRLLKFGNGKQHHPTHLQARRQCCAGISAITWSGVTILPSLKVSVLGEFPNGLLLRTLLSLRKVWVQSSVRELTGTVTRD